MIFTCDQVRLYRVARQLAPEQPESVVRYMASLLLKLVDSEELPLSPAELSLVAEALGGTIFDDELLVRALDADVEDAIRLDHLDEKWGVDREAIIDKLEALSPLARIKLLLLVAAFWSNPERREVPRSLRELQ